MPARITPEERQFLTDWYRQGASALTRSRAHAVLMNSQGLSARKISPLLLRDYKTVRSWLVAFKERRIASLFSQYDGNHNAGKLTPEQREQVRQVLSQSPSEFGLPKEFWQIKDLKRWIQAEFGIVYESDRAYHFLFKLGRFSWKLPDRFDVKRHKGKDLRRELSKGRSLERIHLISFPPYAPDTNPQEHVWKYAKDRISHQPTVSFKQKVNNFKLAVIRRRFNYQI